MRNTLLKLIISTMLVSGPLAAQCPMQFNVSVYSDASVSGDLSTVYGSSNFIDNSTLCGCTHSQYRDVLTIFAPDGTQVSNSLPGTSGSISMATTAGVGTYVTQSTAYLYCSCARQEVQTGGPPAQVSVTPYVQVTHVTPPGTLQLVGNPTSGTATVQVQAVGLWLPGVPTPTVQVALAGSYSDPPGFSIGVANLSPANGQIVMSSSPGNVTYTITVTGVPLGVTSGDMYITGANLGVAPSPWIVKDPNPASNGTASFTTNRGR